MQHIRYMAKREIVRVTLSPLAFEAINTAHEKTKVAKSELVERLIVDYLQPLVSRILGGSQPTK